MKAKKIPFLISEAEAEQIAVALLNNIERLPEEKRTDALLLQQRFAAFFNSFRIK